MKLPRRLQRICLTSWPERTGEPDGPYCIAKLSALRLEPNPQGQEGNRPSTKTHKEGYKWFAPHTFILCVLLSTDALTYRHYLKAYLERISTSLLAFESDCRLAQI